MKVYIIAQWLTQGITIDEVNKTNYTFLVKSTTKQKWYGSKQWFLTLDEAKENVERLRLQQIKTVTKRLDILTNYQLKVSEQLP